MSAENPRLAVLIDADNVKVVINLIDELFAEIAKFGTASIRRIYGDWTNDDLKKWKAVLPKHAIQPIQQFANTKGKNATDSALIIDAMDLLYKAPLDGICIVSSDSDFTRLAVRFRESGMLVYGFGEEKTPEAFRAACDQFIFIEILSSNNEEGTEASDKPGQSSNSATNGDSLSLKHSGSKKSGKELAQDAKLVSLIRSAIEALSDDDGFAHMGEIKKHIVKNFSAFDSRNYGYSKFSDLIAAIGLFEVDTQKQRIKDKRKK